MCRDLAAQEDLVIATGGGALVDAENRKVMQATGCVICLDAGVDAILERVSGDDSRPLLAVHDPGQRIATLLKMREPAYAMIPFHIDTSGYTLDETVQEVKWTASTATTGQHISTTTQANS